MGHIKTIDDVFARFRNGWNGYIREYRFYLVLTLVASIADMLSTIHFMVQSGCDQESHPAIRLVSMVLGPVLGPVISKFCQFMVVVVATIFLRRYAAYIFVAVTILYLWAAWHNISM